MSKNGKQLRYQMPGLLIGVQIGISMRLAYFELDEYKFKLINQVLHWLLLPNLRFSMIDIPLINIAQCLIMGLLISAMGLFLIQLLFRPQQFTVPFVTGITYLLFSLLRHSQNVFANLDTLKTFYNLDQFFSIVVCSVIWFYFSSLLVSHNKHGDNLSHHQPTPRQAISY